MKAPLSCKSCLTVFVSMVVLCLTVETVNSASTTVNYQVSASADDGYAWSVAEQDISSSYLMIGDNRTYSSPFYMSAMRFTNIGVPRSAAIINARLKISSINTDYRGQVCGVIAAEASDNPADFNGRLVGGAALTTATVAWDFKDAWSPDTQYISPDISNIVQEVVNRPGFGSGNSIAIYYSTRDLSGKARGFASYEYSPASAAGLEITYEYYTISGTVKTNRGVPLEGVQIDAGSDIESTVTDANGYYELYVPVGWSGQVKATNSTAWGFNIITQSYTNITADQVNQNFTIFYPNISGTVMKEDGTPLAGATVTIDSVGGSYITDANGYYEIAVPYHWYGTVSANLVGYYFINKSYTHVTTDQTNQNFTAFQPKISGYVKDGTGSGVEGVQVSADNGGGSDATDATGYYELRVPHVWSGTVTPSKTDWGFSPANQTYSNVSSDQVNQDYTAFQPKISGYVKDGSGTGIEGVSVSADNAGGSDTTDTTGYYEIIVPYGWTGTISVSKTDWNLTPSSRPYSNVRSDQTNQDYTAFQPEISGYVRDSNSIGVSAVTVTADNGGGSGTTSSSGYYEITVPYGWSGTVIPSKTGWNITPLSRSYSNVITNQTNEDYTAFQPKISGYVRDGSAGGVEGVSVSADNAGGSDTTDINGYYEIVLPYNWTGTISVSRTGWGFNPWQLTYSNVISDITNQDFAAFQPVISGHVYSDGNGVENAIVSDLTGTFTATTDPNGYYELTVDYNWSGTIKANPESMAFIPAQYDFSGLLTDVNGVDFNETVRLLTRTWKVNYSNNDAYSTRWTGGFEETNVSSPILKVGYDRRYDTYMTCGLRFAPFDVAKQAVILDAYLTLIRATSVPSYEYIRTRGERNPDALPFSSSGPSLWARSRTYAQKTWGWTGGSANTPHVIRELEGIVEEITSLLGWSPGNAIVFLLDPAYTDDTSSPFTFYAIDHSLSNEGLLTVEYEYAPRISGRVITHQGQPVPDVQLNADNGGGSALTNSLGYYELCVPPEWSGIITPNKDFWTFELSPRTYQNVYSDKTNQNFTGIAPVTISGSVKDVNDVPIADVSVSADNGGGTGVTGDDGHYELMVPYDWSGAISASNPLWFFEPNELTYENLSEDVTNQDFTGTAGVILSGYVTNRSGGCIEGVEVAANNGGGIGTTDSNGFYELAVLPGWSGTVKPSKNGRNFIPTIRSYSNLTVDLTNQNFVSLALMVWADGSGDFPTIQQAIDAAFDGDEVIIEPGIYTGPGNCDIYFRGKAITVRSIEPNNPAVVAATIIEPNTLFAIGFNFRQGEQAHSVIDGLTIRRCIGWAAIECYHDSSPTIRNCIIGDNYSYDSGRFGGVGIACYESSPVISNCVIRNNYGSGLRCSISDPTVRNCTFTGNRASHIRYYGDKTLFGGGILFEGGDISVINCTFSGNVADVGGGICSFGSYAYINNMTISNCIFRDNDANDGPQIALIDYKDYPLTVSVSYSVVQGGEAAVFVDPCCMLNWGDGNLDIDPCFAETGFWHFNDTPEDFNDDFWVDGDYHLKSETGRWDPNSQTWIYDTNTSPCIDAGDPNSNWTPELWPHGKRINMGAYGGTPEASMSLSDAGNIADLNWDGSVGYADMIFIGKWLYEGVLLAEDFDRNGFVNFTDVAIFADNWQGTPGLASNPNPADGATGIDLTVDLSWTAGYGTTSHDVYFGTSNPPPFIRNQTAATFDPGTIAPGQYYWRIDEVNSGGATTGTVWSFTTIGLPPPPPPM